MRFERLGVPESAREEGLLMLSRPVSLGRWRSQEGHRHLSNRSAGRSEAVPVADIQRQSVRLWLSLLDVPPRGALPAHRSMGPLRSLDLAQPYAALLPRPTGRMSRESDSRARQLPLLASC